MTGTSPSPVNLHARLTEGLIAIRLMMALVSAASLASAAVLPDGPGKAETGRLCGKCHTLDQAISLRQGQAGWEETIAKMVNLGAQGSDEDFNTVLRYLVKYYGASSGTRAAGAGGTSETGRR